MSMENEKKYDFEETDRVMAELKARLATDAASDASTPPDTDHNSTPAEEAPSPVESGIFVEETIPAEEPAPAEETAPAEEAAPTEDKPPLQELAYAQRGRVFAPFGFAGTQPEAEQKPAEEASDAKSAPAAEEEIAEKPRESRVFAPFGLKDTKIEATGLRARVEAERAAKEAAEVEQAAKEAAEREARLQAAEAAHKAEVTTPMEVDYKERGRVFAPFGFDKNASVYRHTAPQTPAPTAEAEGSAESDVLPTDKENNVVDNASVPTEAAKSAPEKVAVPTAEKKPDQDGIFIPASVARSINKKAASASAQKSAKEMPASPTPVAKPASVASPSESDSLMQDVFGTSDAPEAPRNKKAERKAQKEAKKAEKAAKKAQKSAPKSEAPASVAPTAPKAPQRPAAGERREVPAKGNASSARTAPNRGKKSAPRAGASRAVSVKRPTPPPGAEDTVTLQCGGQTLVIPSDTEQFRPVYREPSGDPTANRELFSALAVTRPDGERRKPRDVAEKATAEQLAFKRSVESSEEDFRLLLGLDYEKELGTAIGYEKIREYHERGLNSGNKEEKGKQKGKKRFEYGSHAQDIVIGKGYTKKRRRLTVDLVVSAVLLILLFVYERLAFMHRWFGGEGESRYPALYVLIGLALFSIGVFILRRQLFEGFMQMVRLAPTDHSLCSVTVVLTYFYHFLLFFLPREGDLSLYLSPAACSMMLLALASLMDGYRESAAFRVVSSKQQKYALVSRVSVANSDGGAADRLMRQESREATLYVRPVEFVRNYYANTEKKPAHNSFFGSLLMIILSIGVAFALFAAMMGAGARAVVHTAFVTVMLCLPALSVLITALPMFLATILRLKRKGAIIGEETVYNQPDTVALVLPEDEIFMPMEHEQFELKPDVDATESAVLIRALLERLESPMVESVSVDPAKRLAPTAVTLTEIEERGVSAVILTGDDQRHTVLFGGVSYLNKYGIRLSPKEESEDLCKRLLCVAIDGRLAALFLARYRFEGEVLSLVNRLAAENVTLVVRTKDPGVHKEQMEYLCRDAAGEIRVIKPLAGELDLRCDRVDATVVALGSCRDAAYTYAVCRRVRRAGSFGGVLQLLSTFVGVLACGALVFFGLAVRVPAFAVTLYMLFWCGLHGLASYLRLRQ